MRAFGNRAAFRRQTACVHPRAVASRHPHPRGRTVRLARIAWTRGLLRKVILMASGNRAFPFATSACALRAEAAHRLGRRRVLRFRALRPDPAPASLPPCEGREAARSSPRAAPADLPREPVPVVTSGAGAARIVVTPARMDAVVQGSDTPASTPTAPIDGAPRRRALCIAPTGAAKGAHPFPAWRTRPLPRVPETGGDARRTPPAIHSPRSTP